MLSRKVHVHPQKLRLQDFYEGLLVFKDSKVISQHPASKLARPLASLRQAVIRGFLSLHFFSPFALFSPSTQEQGTRNPVRTNMCTVRTLCSLVLSSYFYGLFCSKCFAYVFHRVYCVFPESNWLSQYRTRCLVMILCINPPPSPSANIQMVDETMQKLDAHASKIMFMSEPGFVQDRCQL